MCLAAIAMTALTASAQDKVEGTISTDVVNQYIWRGQDLGDVSIQPTLGIAYKGFSLSAWGNVGLSDKDDTKELDLTATYTTGGFHIGVTDYWFNSPNDRLRLRSAGCQLVYQLRRKRWSEQRRRQSLLVLFRVGRTFQTGFS